MSGTALQTLTLEYRALNGFDGSTPAPAFDQGTVTPAQIHRFDVADLGLLPLQLPIEGDPVGNGAYAKRWLCWVLVYGVVVDPLIPWIELAITNTGDPNPSVPVLSYLTGVIPVPPGFIGEGVYARRCLFVPQGYNVRVSNIAPFPDGRPAVIRTRVIVEQSAEDEASWMDACCCKANLPDNNIIIPAPG
jgi:hypothetical protein